MHDARTQDTDLRPGPELNERVAAEVAGWMLVYQYSTDIRSAMELADVLHRRIDTSRLLYNYLVLVRTGLYGECWVASFDFNHDAEWYGHIEDYPLAARGETAAHAICLAMLKVAAVVKADYEKRKNDMLPRRVEI